MGATPMELYRGVYLALSGFDDVRRKQHGPPQIVFGPFFLPQVLDYKPKFPHQTRLYRMLDTMIGRRTRQNMFHA
jgi:hypothetical protein